MDKAPLDSEESPFDSEGIDADLLSSTEEHVIHNSTLYHNPESDRFSSDDENEIDEKGYDEEEEEEYSLFENKLEELTDEALSQGEPNMCSLEEAIDLRKKLRQIGPAKFLETTVGAGKIGAKKLLSAFGIRPPVLKNRLPDSAYFGLLSLAISRELSNRIKLPQYNTVDDAVSLIKNAKNIIVLTGAGISTSLGIPDFRSKDVGLYSKLNHLGLNDPQEVFDINIFKEDPSIFYSIAGDILPETHRFSPTHAFIYLLQQKGKLLTNYSQNIDNIEKVAGILPEKLIQCHGSFATASCVECKYQVPGDTIFDDIRAFRIPRCKNCIKNISTLETSSFTKRKRSSNRKEKKRKSNMCHSSEISSDEDNIQEAGVMKPDITFFGEPLPDGFSDRLTNHDKDLVDLVIVIGTSLKVAPVSEIVSFLPAKIPQIYISRTRVSHVKFDVDLLGDCDVVVAELCRRAGWDLNHEMVPKDQKIQINLQEGFIHRHVFTVQNQ